MSTQDTKNAYIPWRDRLRHSCKVGGGFGGDITKYMLAGWWGENRGGSLGVFVCCANDVIGAALAASTPCWETDTARNKPPRQPAEPALPCPWGWCGRIYNAFPSRFSSLPLVVPSLTPGISLQKWVRLGALVRTSFSHPYSPMHAFFEDSRSCKRSMPTTTEVCSRARLCSDIQQSRWAAAPANIPRADSPSHGLYWPPEEKLPSPQPAARHPSTSSSRLMPRYRSCISVSPDDEGP